MRTVLLLAAAIGTAATAPCQLEATTLERLTRTAPIVAQVVVEATGVGAEHVEVRLSPRRVWRGELRAPAVLTEDRHEHCGAALAGLYRGQELVLFAEVVGQQVRPLGGGRGIVQLGLSELPAIEALLAASEAPARLALLVAQLDHPSPRVRDDAALALPGRPGLETATGAVKARLALQLETSLRQRDPTLVASLFAVIRSEPERAARTAWQLCLADGPPELVALGHRVLVREIDAKVAAVTAPLPEAAAQAQRVAALLSEMRQPEARPALHRLALHADLEVRTAAARGLLALGDDASAVASLAGADVVQAALATPAPPAKRRAILRQR